MINLDLEHAAGLSVKFTMENKQEKQKSTETSLLYSFSLLRKLLNYINVAPGSFTYLYLILGIIALIQLPAPFLFKSIIDNVLPNNNTNLLIVIILSLVFVELLKNVFSVINTFLLAKISQKLAADLRKKIFWLRNAVSSKKEDVKPNQIQSKRKDVARILTVLRERELQQNA